MIFFVTEPIEFNSDPVLVGKEGEDLKVSCGVTTTQFFTLFWTRLRGDIQGEYITILLDSSCSYYFLRCAC